MPNRTVAVGAFVIGGLLLLSAVLVLNIYKPRGLTRYGWRKLSSVRLHEGQGPS